ncbi:hypothetical protein BD408DRAFT_426614 [Parasitella parasitica]|nr:hypothetical protein BD408DRAFT_426614 [Parasitella parasitica]
MSEPQSKPVDELIKSSAPAAEQAAEEQVPITLPASNDPPTQTTNSPENNNTNVELTGHVKTLKDAFPDLDVDVIETILASQGGNLDAAFEVLLNMSDPTYKPEPNQAEGMNQLRQDEEYARRLAREGDPHYPQNNAQQPTGQPQFSLQDELAPIKEKVIEAGTAAKNKIMNFYNQFMAPDQTSQQQQGQSSQSGVLESRMGNLSLSDNRPTQQQSRPTPPSATSRGSVDLYEWDGSAQSPINNPLLSTRKESVTSTSAEQLLSDEEFARQLAREDTEGLSPAVTSNTHPATTTTDTDTAAAAAAAVDSPAIANKNAKSTISSDNEEVTFSALEDDPEKVTRSIDHARAEDDDLDDLFDKQDSNLELSVESANSVDKETSKASKK